MMHSRRNLMLACLLGLCVPAIGNDEQSKKPAGEPEFITKAIEELRAEAEAAVKDPVKATLREKSDYFGKTSESLGEADLIKLLGRRIDRNAAVDAYVKWQLLSLQKGPFSEENAKAAFKLYRSAPAAPARPGTGNDSEMQSMLRQVNKDNYSQANAAWEARLAAHGKIATPIWKYREELYSRLPKAFEVVRAGFDDAEMRMQRGYDPKDFLNRVSGDLRALAAGAKPVEINRMAQLARFYAGREGAQTYNSLEEDKGQIKWKTGRLRFDKKRMDELAKDLEETAKLGF
jgi:hypothetical protein